MKNTLTLLTILFSVLSYGQVKNDTIRVEAKLVKPGIGSKVYIAQYKVLKVVKGTVTNDTINVGYYGYLESKITSDTVLLNLMPYEGITKFSDYYIFPDYDPKKWIKEKGKMYTIKGLVTDKKSNDTLTRVIIEFKNKDNKLIEARESDFDGMYRVSFCSKRLLNDSLYVKVTKDFYKQETFAYKIVSDTILPICMNWDSKKTISKEKYLKYRQKMQYSTGCGLVDKEYNEIKYQQNRSSYQHYCTGEIKKYRQLIDDKNNLSEWILIEK